MSRIVSTISEQLREIIVSQKGKTPEYTKYFAHYPSKKLQNELENRVVWTSCHATKRWQKGII